MLPELCHSFFLLILLLVSVQLWFLRGCEDSELLFWAAFVNQRQLLSMRIKHEKPTVCGKDQDLVAGERGLSYLTRRHVQVILHLE